MGNDQAMACEGGLGQPCLIEGQGTERLDQIAEGIERLGGGAPLASASSMLGREVSFDTGGFAPVTATVDSVRIVDGVVTLSAGGYDVPITALTEIKGAAAAAPTIPGPLSVPTTPTVPPDVAVDPSDVTTTNGGTVSNDPASSDDADAVVDP